MKKTFVLFRETLLMLKGRKRNILYANKWSHDGGGVFVGCVVDVHVVVVVAVNVRDVIV